MDGTIVSAMRTGAVSGLAARELARPGARIVTLYGAGVQARTQLAALERTLPDLAEVRVYDPRAEQSARFVADQADGRPPIVAFDDPREAARGSDVLVPASMASAPFIGFDWLEPGALVLSVSSLDIDVDVIAEADLVVTDDLEHETFHPSRPLSRARDSGLLVAEAVIPLGAILANDASGPHEPGRPDRGFSSRHGDRGRCLRDHGVSQGRRAGNRLDGASLERTDLDLKGAV